MVDLSTVSSMVSRSSNETERPACIMVRNTRMRMAVGCMSLLANRSKYFFSSIFSI